MFEATVVAVVVGLTSWAERMSLITAVSKRTNVN